MPVSNLRRICILAIAVLPLAIGTTLLAQRGGGARGARTSVNRSFSGASASRSFSGGSVDRSANVNRSFGSADVNRNVTNVNANRNINNVNVNRNVNNVNVNRNVNVDRDVDVDRRYGGWGDGCCYHPAATAAAVTAAAMTTAAVVGSVVHSLPPSCSAINVNGITYQQCGSTWYQPQFAGTTVNYVVVNSPQ